MKSPESFIRLPVTPLSFSLLLVFLCLLLFSSASAAAPLSAPRPPHRHQSSSTAPLASTAARSITSSPPSPFTSTTRPIHLSSTAPLTSLPRPTTSSTVAPPTPPSLSSSSHPIGPTIYGSRMSLARMLSLVFVSLLFLILVISFIWYSTSLHLISPHLLSAHLLCRSVPPLISSSTAVCDVYDRYFWRKQWLAARQQHSLTLSDDGWLRVDERGQVVRDDAVHQAPQPYQPSMLSYMTSSPTPAALTISYQPYVDVSTQRQYVRF